VKGQQLFHSLLPGITAAVLTTQPVWAGSLVPVSAVKLKTTNSSIELLLETPKNATPQVVTSQSDGSLVADIANAQLQNSTGNSWQAILPDLGMTTVSVRQLNGNSIRVTVKSQNGVPYEKIRRKEQGIVFTLTNPKAKTSAVSGIASPEEAVATPVTKKDIANNNIVNTVNTTVVPAVNNTSPIARTNTPKTQPTTKPTPLPIKVPPTRSTPPENGTSKSRVDVPDYLNPVANPLQFPTKTEEVRIRGTQPITLTQALELARRNNRDLQISISTLARSRAGLRQAQASLLPTANLTADLGATRDSASTDAANSRRTAGTPVISQPDPTTSLSGNAELSYSLYTSGERTARIRTAEEQLRSDELDVERQSEDTRLNVTNDYYSLQQADETVRIQQSAVGNALASLNDAIAQLNAGVGTRFDVLRFQVNLANAQQNLTNALSQQVVARRQLANRISLAQTVNVSAADPVQLAGLWNLTLEESILQAFQNRAELQQVLAQRNISEQQRRVALSQLGPKLNFVASYNLIDQFGDTVPASKGYSVGLQASLNLFDGGAAAAGADQQRANISIAEANFARQRNQIRFDVEQYYANLQSNLNNVNTSSVALNQARESVRLAQLRFRAGVGTQTEVISAQDAQTQAEGNRISAIVNYNRSLASLQRAVSASRAR